MDTQGLYSSFPRQSSHFIHLPYGTTASHYPISPSATWGTRTRENCTSICGLPNRSRWKTNSLDSNSTPQPPPVTQPAHIHAYVIPRSWPQKTHHIQSLYCNISISIFFYVGGGKGLFSFVPRAWRKKAGEEGKETYSCCWHRGPEGRSHSASTLSAYSAHSAAAPGCPRSSDPDLSSDCLVNPCKSQICSPPECQLWLSSGCSA